MKSCTQCNQYLLFKDFNRSGGGFRLRGNCKKCEYRITKQRLNGERREELLENQRFLNIKYKYSLAKEDFLNLLKKQNYSCSICSESLNSRSAIDHDHNCCPGLKSCGKCIRGILCNNCNVGLGLFKDDPSLLYKAITYLKEKELDD